MREISRRTLLGVGAGTVGVAVVDGGAAHAAGRGVSPTNIRRSHYTGSLGKTFTIRHEGRTIRLVLKRIDDLGAGTTKPERQFALSLENPRGKVVPDGIYVLRRRGVPRHRLLLSGCGQDGRMQVVVNRL
ncbi:DUF6916 family protein [Nocardioides hwasunensis]|uniref:DUF6916 domain-containing protein n=1 Tax=Nocardioides hwasunensis TaxID=397258 RepID=A0ABR8MH90_9ACTN|nr:hypothetical protein [Nocardioides hwasunensis]MBD3915332.1 hypothetical protein [Nocardioides hwasunensis]